MRSVLFSYGLIILSAVSSSVSYSMTLIGNVDKSMCLWPFLVKQQLYFGANNMALTCFLGIGG